MNLKPCPFCGSENLRAPTYWTPFIECLDCGAFGPGDSCSLDSHGQNWEAAAAESVDKWNARVGGSTP